MLYLLNYLACKIEKEQTLYMHIITKQIKKKNPASLVEAVLPQVQTMLLTPEELEELPSYIHVLKDLNSNEPNTGIISVDSMYSLIQKLPESLKQKFQPLLTAAEEDLQANINIDQSRKIAEAAILELSTKAVKEGTILKSFYNEYISGPFTHGALAGKKWPTPWKEQNKEELTKKLKDTLQVNRFIGASDSQICRFIKASPTLHMYLLYCYSTAAVYAGTKEYFNGRITGYIATGNRVAAAIDALSKEDKQILCEDLKKKIKSIKFYIPHEKIPGELVPANIAARWIDAEDDFYNYTSNTPGGVLEGVDYIYRYDARSTDTNYNLWFISALTTFSCAIQELSPVTQGIIQVAINEAAMGEFGGKTVSAFTDIAKNHTLNNIPFIRTVIIKLFSKNLHFYDQYAKTELSSDPSVINPRNLNGEETDYSDALIADVLNDSNSEVPDTPEAESTLDETDDLS